MRLYQIIKEIPIFLYEFRVEIYGTSYRCGYMELLSAWSDGSMSLFDFEDAGEGAVAGEAA